MKTNITIAGLGLIGGSLAKAISQSPKNIITGFDTNEFTIKYALEKNVINEASRTFKESVAKADVIILATPISETIQLINELDHINFSKEVIVTDVSSVKGSIISSAKNISNDKVTFIGGHPMAGSHKNGIQAAKKHLFENALYILTPTDDKSNGEVERLKEILRPTKSRFVTLQPEEHDEMTGVVSHFPHLIASSLVHQAKSWEKEHAYLPSLAAGGFRDITRIASSNPELWQDIFYHNGYKMSLLLKDWIVEMSALKDILNNNNKEDMINYLNEAKQYRDGLPIDQRGAIPSFYDVYVDIKDRPGELALVVQMLAVKDISITNIRILEIRDGMKGALRISLPTKEAQTDSFNLLKEYGYEVVVEQ